MAYTIGKKMKHVLRIRNETLREFLAEFLGTFVLILFGNSSVAQYKLFDDNLGTYLSVNWSWGIAVAMGVWISGGVTGGHINPAVSVAMTILGRLSFFKCLVYMAAQYLGAILASSVVFAVYLDAINHYEMNGTAEIVRTIDTAGIWATYPQDFILWSTGLADQIVGTAMLVVCVMAVTDKNNLKPPTGMEPLAVGLAVVVIGMSLGSNCGYAINPARDLGPRIFTAMAGWGSAPFDYWEDQGYWFWIPVVGPHIGAIIGAWMYLLCVGIHLEENGGDGGDDDSYDGGDVFEMSNGGNSGKANTTQNALTTSSIELKSHNNVAYM